MKDEGKQDRDVLVNSDNRKAVKIFSFFKERDINRERLFIKSMSPYIDVANNRYFWVFQF